MSELESSNNEQFFTDYCLGGQSPYVALRVLRGSNFPVILEGRISYPS